MVLIISTFRVRMILEVDTREAELMFSQEEAGLRHHLMTSILRNITTLTL